MEEGRAGLVRYKKGSHEVKHPAILETIEALGETTLIADPAKIVDLCRFLKDTEKFIRLSPFTAVDWHPAQPRCELVYHPHSLEPFPRLRVKTSVSAGTPQIEAVTSV